MRPLSLPPKIKNEEKKNEPQDTFTWTKEKREQFVKNSDLCRPKRNAAETENRGNQKMAKSTNDEGKKVFCTRPTGSEEEKEITEMNSGVNEGKSALMKELSKRTGFKMKKRL